MGTVLLVMGHRNTSGGDPEEARRTPLIVDAAARELRRAGHTVHVLQHEDNDADPNFTHADLAFVANRCTDLIRQRGIQVMIDAHFQGSGNPTSGCFCIFPDGNGLSPQPPVDDSKAANQLDVAFSAKLAEEVSRQTGIPRLHLSEPGFLGGMSERQTGVGGQGFRLGMFNLTVPVKGQCVRVVMEHGDIRADSGVINSPGFFDRVAAAYVRAINAFWPVVPADPQFFAFSQPQTFTAHAGAFGRHHASTDSAIVRQYKGGDAIRCLGYYEAQQVSGDNRWLRSTGPGAPRIHSSGVIEEIPSGTLTQPPDEREAPNGRVSREERLARAEAARRGDQLEATGLTETGAIGCGMITSVSAEAVAGD